MGVLKQPTVTLNRTGPSDDEMAFIRAIKAAHPEEDTVRLVYADWLDESGPPEREKLGFAIRENLHFRRGQQAYVEPNSHKRYNEYDYAVKSRKAVWYGHEAATWEVENDRRKILFQAGMLIIRGEPADLSKFPMSAAPWVQRLIVRGPGGAGDGGGGPLLHQTHEAVRGRTGADAAGRPRAGGAVGGREHTGRIRYGGEGGGEGRGGGEDRPRRAGARGGAEGHREDQVILPASRSRTQPERLAVAPAHSCGGAKN